MNKHDVSITVDSPPEREGGRGNGSESPLSDLSEDATLLIQSLSKSSQKEPGSMPKEISRDNDNPGKPSARSVVISTDSDDRSSTSSGGPPKKRWLKTSEGYGSGADSAEGFQGGLRWASDDSSTSSGPPDNTPQTAKARSEVSKNHSLGDKCCQLKGKHPSPITSKGASDLVNGKNTKDSSGATKDSPKKDNSSSSQSNPKKRKFPPNQSNYNDGQRKARNAREQERSQKVSEQFTTLQDLLTESGLVVQRGTKSNVLSVALDYIQKLQKNHRQAEWDNQLLLQQIQSISKGSLGEQAARLIHNVAAQNGLSSNNSLVSLPSSLSTNGSNSCENGQTNHQENTTENNATMTELNDWHYSSAFQIAPIPMVCTCYTCVIVSHCARSPELMLQFISLVTKQPFDFRFFLH